MPDFIKHLLALSVCINNMYASHKIVDSMCACCIIYEMLYILGHYKRHAMLDSHLAPPLHNVYGVISQRLNSWIR